MSEPLVSIIIPTFNRAHLIGETLDSVLAQTYTNWECIVVDDGSTDNTDAVMTEYCAKDARFQYHHRPKDRLPGGNAARNYGFELSKGEYVNWFDSDDLMHSKKLLIQVDALENSPNNFSVCQTLVFKNDLANRIGLRFPRIDSENPFEDYVMQKVGWLTQSPIWKKEFLLTVDYLFDEELLAAQEWEFHSRILYMCSDYNVINEPLVYVRKHEESISCSNNQTLRVANYYKAREKVYNLIKNDPNVIFLTKYLLNYFIVLFKEMLVTRQFSLALRVYVSYVFVNKNLSVYYRFKLAIAIGLYFLTGKGYFLSKE